MLLALTCTQQGRIFLYICRTRRRTFIWAIKALCVRSLALRSVARSSIILIDTDTFPPLCMLEGVQGRTRHGTGIQSSKWNYWNKKQHSHVVVIWLRELLRACFRIRRSLYIYSLSTLYVFMWSTSPHIQQLSWAYCFHARRALSSTAAALVCACMCVFSFFSISRVMPFGREHHPNPQRKCNKCYSVCERRFCSAASARYM
jgi:hypothetical protein